MAIIVSYAHPEVCDQYLVRNSQGLPVWQSGRLGGALNAIEFESEQTARSFLVAHGFKLDPLKTCFVPVQDKPVTFADLAVDDTFDWINPNGGAYNSFFKRCRKIDRFRYVAIDCATEKYRVGSLSARVYHVLPK